MSYLTLSLLNFTSSFLFFFPLRGRSIMSVSASSSSMLKGQSPLSKDISCHGVIHLHCNIFVYIGK